MKRVLALVAAAASTSIATVSAAAPTAPSGPHPRLFLSGPVLEALTAKSKDTASMTAKVVKTCDDVVANPDNWAKMPSYDFLWGVAATSCAMAWEITKKPEHAQGGIKMLNALLDDKATVGDGAGGDKVVQQDDGYFIRIYAPYAAIAYDWLHEAPGMDAALKAKVAERFKAWIDWYAASGYLPHQVGANYHSGYVFAKTTVAVALSGDDPAGATYFADVVDTMFTKEIVGTGLAPGGVLNGGDWAEGWQYGPLSVLSYSLSARAISEQGATFPEIATWTNSLALRFFNALSPDRNELYTGGDFEDSGFNTKPHPRIPLATLVGASSDEAASWAAFGRKTIANDDEALVFIDALAEARNVQPVDLGSATASKWYVAPGTRRLYARGAWDRSASWVEFQSSPHQVPDHEHADASNVTLYHGADALIVDPSPYGSLSTLTGNALTVESNAVGDDYKPSQAVWSSLAELPWSRAGQSGIVAARADLSNAFNSSKASSDVPYAHREFVFLPEGDVVLMDRARTDDATRGLRVRFHTPSALTLSGSTAKADIGSSSLRIIGVQVSGQTASQKMTTVGDCYSGTRGDCEATRFVAGEYDLRVPGPTSLAVHVISGLKKGEAETSAISVNDPSVDPAKNPSIVGTVVQRGTVRTMVVGSSAKDGAAGATLSYLAPAGGARSVVYDAPEATDGSSTVVAAKEGNGCRVTITAAPAPGKGFTGRPLMFTLGSATDPCAVLEDKVAPPGVAPGSTGTAGDGGVAISAEANADGDASGGCGCVEAGRNPRGMAGNVGIVAASGLLASLFLRRRRRSA